MKLPPTHLLAAACFAAFASAGWQAAAPGKPATSNPAGTPSAKASQRGPRSAGKSAVPEDVRQRLAAIHGARTPDERLRATLALAHSLPVSEMERVKDSGDLVKEMLKHPDSLPDGWFAAAAAASPYYLVNEDPGKWLDTDLAAMGFNDEQSQQLLNYAMSYLGPKDPDRALALLDGDSLDPNQRTNLLSSTLSHLAREDKARAEAWVATLTDPQEIEQAHRVLQSASEDAAGKTPPTPSEWLTGLADQNDSAMWRYAGMTQSWGRDELAAAAADFQKLPTDQKSVVAAKLANNQSSLPTPLRAEAIRHLLENPVEPVPDAVSNGADNPLVRSTATLASTWGREDPAAAGRWIRSLPAGDERLWAAKNLAAQWAEYEPAAARQWAAGLPAGERQQVVDYLDNGGVQ